MLKVFLTDLAAYNAGSLVGRWVELPITGFELSQAISEVLTEGEHAIDGENHEEYFITDYEWEDIQVFEVFEYENLDTLNSKVEALAELEPSDLAKVSFLLKEGISSEVEYAMEKIDDVIVYENSTFTDIAEQYIDECVDLNTYNPIIINHIDHEGIGRDLELDGSYFSVGQDIYQYVA